METLLATRKLPGTGIGGCGYVSDGVATVAGDLRIHP
jgi:hypothetical protein